MSGYLADTNTISEYAKPKPDPRVIQWLESADPDTLFVSVITLGELRLGIESLPASRRRNDLETWLTTGLPEWFASNAACLEGHRLSVGEDHCASEEERHTD